MTNLLFIIVPWSVSASALVHGMLAEDQAWITNDCYLDHKPLGATHLLSDYDHLLTGLHNGF